jgi:hypothetical protein
MAKWIVFCFLVLVGCQAAQTQPIPTEADGQWLTTPLEPKGELLVFAGPDLSNQVGQGKVFTYYSRGSWVALLWQGYINDENVWSITSELKTERPDWETNQNWSLDFWWPISRGDPPAGSAPGTSAQ